MLTHERWRGYTHLRHGFLDRRESAAAGGGDWERALQAVGVELPVSTARQVHGVRVVEAALLGAPREDADGVITAGRGLAVGVITADCVPALLLAERRGVVAAVHAGWRGAAAGVLESALALLHARFGVAAGEVDVALGPAIGPCCYRVGAEVQAAFTARTGSLTASAWTPAGGRLLLDLRRAARLLLEAAGVHLVETVGPCTACTTDLASYRRDGGDAGRQLSFIGWTAAPAG